VQKDSKIISLFALLGSTHKKLFLNVGEIDPRLWLLNFLFVRRNLNAFFKCKLFTSSISLTGEERLENPDYLFFSSTVIARDNPTK